MAAGEWEQYAIPLGRGLADALPQNPEEVHPARLEGLQPGGRRLYSFQEARRVPHESLEALIGTSRRLVTFDHLGMRYEEFRTGGQTVFYLQDARAGKQNKFTFGLASSGSYPSMALFEQAGLTGSSALEAGGTRRSLYHVLQGESLESNSSHTSGLSGLNWSMAVAAQASGDLDAHNDGVYTSARVTVTAVRCVKTEAGLMGVSVMLGTDSLDLSTEGGAKVTITQVDSVESYYVLYAQFMFSDSSKAVPNFASDWLLMGTVDTLNGLTPEFMITAVPIGETLPGGQGGYLLQPLAGSLAVRHQGRYFAVSGEVGQEAANWMTALVTAPPTYVRSLGGIEALPAGRSVVYSAGLAIQNMGTHTTYFTPQLSASERITALVSSPAGLLIFGENEVLVARGNPDSTDFRVEPLSAVIGCDPGVVPARLGGVVFTVHRGRLWAVNLGSGQEGLTDVLTDLSASMRVPDVVSVVDNNGVLELAEGGFVDVRADSRHSQILALRGYNRSRDDAESVTSQVYRYDLRSGQWFDDPVATNGGWALNGSPGNDGLWRVVPCSDEYGVRYYPLFDMPLDLTIPADDWSYRHSPRYFVGRQGGSFVLEFTGVDCGMPGVEKQFRRVHVYAEGLGGTPDTLRAPDAIPHLNVSTPVVLYYRSEQVKRDGFGPDPGQPWVDSRSVGREVRPGHYVFEFRSDVIAESLMLRLEGTLFRGEYPSLTDRWLSTPYVYLESPLVVDYQVRRVPR